VSFGLLSQLDHPLFHIHVLGREAKGNLARPFKKQGLAASLTGPSEAIKVCLLLLVLLSLPCLFLLSSMS